MADGTIEFRVLGPLEMRIGGEVVALGGAKQRAVLAALLLRAGEVVPVERLVDEVWGDDPPPSAAHTLESYVSRLRTVFNGHGPTLVRRGLGYVLELHGSDLDASRFIEIQERAALAAAVDAHADVVQLADAALAIWCGPALADVALASAGRAEAERLEELRLCTYELRFDAEIALGRHDQAVGQLQSLVAQNPYRERFVAQLMLALYRSGRHAEALEAYERMRRRLDEDLGLQPSAELQQLSGQIVRQDPALRRPSAMRTHVMQDRPVQRRSRRMVELVLVGSLVAAIMALTASGSSPQRPVVPSPQFTTVSGYGHTTSPGAPRVALVLPKNVPNRSRVPVMRRVLTDAEGTWDIDGALLQPDETDSRQIANLVRRIESGHYALVLIVGSGDLATEVATVVRRSAQTKFIFFDASLADLGLEGVENALAVRFANEHASQLAGYLSAIVPARGYPPVRADVVSVIAGPRTSQQDRVIAGFEEGVLNARPKLPILVGHVTDPSDPTECEELANEQINQGSDVLFIAAGPCGLGAVAVARLRGVWAVGASEDGVDLDLGKHVLATTYEEFQQAAFAAMQDFVLNAAEFGHDLVLGLDDAYAVGIDTNRLVSDPMWSKVVLECSKIRQRAAASES